MVADENADFTRLTEMFLPSFHLIARDIHYPNISKRYLFTLGREKDVKGSGLALFRILSNANP